MEEEKSLGISNLGLSGCWFVLTLGHCPLTRLRRELPQRGSLSCHIFELILSDKANRLPLWGSSAKR